MEVVISKEKEKQMKDRDKEIRKELNKNLGWCMQGKIALIKKDTANFIKAINKIIDEEIKEVEKISDILDKVHQAIDDYFEEGE